MKYLSILGLLICIILSSCGKIIPDLPRDNPLDGKNDTSMVDGVSIKYSSYSIVGDDNNDGIANKGETVFINVNLINNGTSAANAVKATFSTDNSNVSLLSPTGQISYGDISAGSSASGSSGYATSGTYTIKFKISSSTPNNTQIPININIIDESGNMWTSSFSITVEGTGSQLAFSSYSIVGDNNNDGIVNKGETVYLKVNIANNGSSTANAVNAIFSTTSSNVSLLSPTGQISYGNISAGSSAFGSSGYATSGVYTIKFKVSSTTPNNTQIPFTINITDGSGNIWTSNFNVMVEGTNAQLAFDSYSLVGDDNNNGIINIGETVYLKVNIVNNGSSTANAVKAIFSTTNSNVSLLSPTGQISYGNISAGSSAFGSSGYATSGVYTIKFKISNSAPNNTQIPININIVDESGNTWTANFNVIAL